MKGTKTRTGFILTVVLALIGLIFFNHSFSQPEIQILQDLAKIDGGGFTSKILLFYAFTKLITSLFVEITAPIRLKFSEYVNAWIDAKIKKLK